MNRTIDLARMAVAVGLVLAASSFGCGDARVIVARVHVPPDLASKAPISRMAMNLVRCDIQVAEEIAAWEGPFSKGSAEETRDVDIDVKIPSDVRFSLWMTAWSLRAGVVPVHVLVAEACTDWLKGDDGILEVPLVLTSTRGLCPLPPTTCTSGS